MQALNIHAGPKALAHLRSQGLRPADIHTIPAAAGGPKGLILGPLDRFLFGAWLSQSEQPVHLVGASIGAWRMATACLDDALAGFQRLEHDYIHQHYQTAPGQKKPTADQVSAEFARNLDMFYRGKVTGIVQHSRYKLHIVTSRGRFLLRREHAWRTPLGYTGAYLSNLGHRKALGRWLERVVFSAPGSQPPCDLGDFRSRVVSLSTENFMPALQASCSIPFVLRAVHDIPGAPPGAYWDGGITDYHLHLNYAARAKAGLVLYPHFQAQVVPGWLDKALTWRHHSTAFLDNMIVVSPKPEWIARLPNAKLPDRQDFMHYGNDLASRVRVWTQAVRASEQLADEWQAWLERPDLSQVQALL